MTNLFLLEKFVSIVMMYLSTLLRPGSSGGQLSELTSSDEKYSPDWPGADRSLHSHGAGQEGGGGGAGGEGGLWWGVVRRRGR